MFNTTYTTYTRYTAYAMIFLMFLISFGNTGLTRAYYSDMETSEDNIFVATELDFLLTAPLVSFVGLTQATKTPAFMVSISTTTNSLPFDYNLRVDSASGVLCDVLSLEGSLESISQAAAELTSFSISTTSFPLMGDTWDFVVALEEETDGSYSNTDCQFSVVYSGWQFDFSEGKAYHDVETVTFTITAGTWESTFSTSTASRNVAGTSTNLSLEELLELSPEELIALQESGVTLPPEVLDALTDEIATRPREEDDGESDGNGGGGGDDESEEDSELDESEELDETEETEETEETDSEIDEEVSEEETEDEEVEEEEAEETEAVETEETDEDKESSTETKEESVPETEEESESSLSTVTE